MLPGVAWGSHTCQAEPERHVGMELSLSPELWGTQAGGDSSSWTCGVLSHPLATPTTTVRLGKTRAWQGLGPGRPQSVPYLGVGSPTWVGSHGCPVLFFPGLAAAPQICTQFQGLTHPGTCTVPRLITGLPRAGWRPRAHAPASLPVPGLCHQVPSDGWVPGGWGLLNHHPYRPFWGSVTSVTGLQVETAPSLTLSLKIFLFEREETPTSLT